MKLKPTKLQIKTTKRLVAMAFSYFISGMVFGGLTGSWWMAGLIGAGAAITRVSVALSKEYAYWGNLDEAKTDEIIKKQIDVNPPKEKK